MPSRGLKMVIAAAAVVIVGVRSFAYEPVRIKNMETGAVLVVTQEGVVQTGFWLPTMAAVVQIGAPSIGAIYADSKRIVVGDYVKSRPDFSVTLSPMSGSDISRYELAVIQVLTDTVIASTSNTIVGGVTQSIAVTFRPETELQSGYRYYLRAIAIDSNGVAVTENSAEFAIEDGFKFEQVMNSPNPFNPNQELTYLEAQLTKETEIVASIYSLSGELIWKQTQTGTPGYWSIPWDGRNMFGEIVPNGAYIAVLAAKAGSERRTAKLKVGVLR